MGGGEGSWGESPRQRGGGGWYGSTVVESPGREMRK